jgi:catechol 2,3-dioxygenase-like lactoylglutathione lyase family enzyme
LSPIAACGGKRTLTQIRSAINLKARAVGRNDLRAGRATPAYISSTEMRPMPNLENLKKQAKLYLHWHRDHYYPVAAQIRSVLPRFRHLSDREVLAHSFKLSDAQELIARKVGFESWEALRKGVQTMTDTQSETLSKPALLNAAPQLFVADIAVSCEFYTKRLGFSVAFTYGEPPFYGSVFRDGATLNLRCLSEPAIDPKLRDREDLLSALITLDDAKPLFLEFQAAGVSFHQGLKTEPWGARTFIVRDPDGNLIHFAGRGA